MSSKYIYLSYFMDDKTPIYGGSKGIKIKDNSSIENGDTANTKILSFHNHSGTHIDFPNHFILNGKKSDDYTADFWIFDNPFLIEVPVTDDELINIDHELLNSIPSNTDFLIFNTGFYKLRNDTKFWKHNPGFSPLMAEKLKLQCPYLRVIAMDTISLTSFQNRKIGRIAHKKFLGDSNLLIVEDINLKELNSQPKKIMCFPLMIKGIDGSPVSIIAEI
jgi:arylformamidase